MAQVALFGPKRSGSCSDGYPLCRTWNFYVDVEGANDAARDKQSARQKSCDCHYYQYKRPNCGWKFGGSSSVFQIIWKQFEIIDNISIQTQAMIFSNVVVSVYSVVSFHCVITGYPGFGSRHNAFLIHLHKRNLIIFSEHVSQL